MGIPDHKLGKLEGNIVRKELTVSDVVNYTKKSTLLGRLITKISLAFQGKGWITTAKINVLLSNQKSLDVLNQLEKSLTTLSGHVKQKNECEKKLIDKRIGKINRLISNATSSIYHQLAEPALKKVEILQKQYPNDPFLQNLKDRIAASRSRENLNDLSNLVVKLNRYSQLLLELKELHTDANFDPTQAFHEMNTSLKLDEYIDPTKITLENKQEALSNEIESVKSVIDFFKQFQALKAVLDPAQWNAISDAIAEENISLAEDMIDNIDLLHYPGLFSTEKSDTITSIKMDPSKVNVYQNHFPGLVNFEDLKDIYAEQVPQIPLLIQFSDNPPISQTSVDMSMEKAEGKETRKLTTYNAAMDAHIAIQSAYPESNGDPTADHAMFRKFQTTDGGEVYLYSGADGCGWGQKSRQAAIVANQTFMDETASQMQEGNIHDMQDLSKAMMTSVGAAHKKIYQEPYDHHNPEILGSTTHTGIVIKKEADGRMNGVVTAIGDMKVFLRKANGSIIELTKNSRGNATDATDPGGRIGSFGSAHPDMRNFTMVTFTAEHWDTILPMSDGVHDNLDPEKLGLKSPQEALNWLRGRGIPEEQLQTLTGDNWDQPSGWKDDTPQLEELKSLFLVQKMEEVIKSHPHDFPNVALVKHAYALTNPGRKLFDQGIFNKTTSYQDAPGKFDHVSCGAIYL